MKNILENLDKSTQDWFEKHDFKTAKHLELFHSRKGFFECQKCDIIAEYNHPNNFTIGGSGCLNCVSAEQMADLPRST